MTESQQYPGQLVFGLDIGTRSVVGTVGYKDGDLFYVAAQEVLEHKTRAMLDGQIHDIGKVGETVAQIRSRLEEKLQRKLNNVCIAAAGRVLKTVSVHVETEFSEEKQITKEDVYSLDSLGVEKAYEEFSAQGQPEEKFYCVGYSIVKYYRNEYPISNLVDHKARNISADLIATFLPDDVVDGLYRAVELGGLQVANLTLEPIAAIQVAIPEMYRMLNIALIDVGAGTSDICITRDGSVAAYGMIPCAGDILTEAIAAHCLVDFVTADRIKKEIGENETVSYQDIMFLPQTISRQTVETLLEPLVESMARQAAEKIKELNGGKPVSAVFVIGGGGKFSGYTEKVAQYLEIQKERVALRGPEVMQQIVFPEGIEKDALLVTPLGICVNYYEHNNSFLYVTFNETKVKLYDNGMLTVVDAAIQAEFPNEGLFPQRGTALNFTVDGKKRIVRGLAGEAADISLNGKPADLHTPIEANDKITIVPSTKGKDAYVEAGSLPEYQATLTIFVNDTKVVLPKFVSVNGTLQSAYYRIQENDDIHLLQYYTVKQIAEFMDMELPQEATVYVNHQVAAPDTVVYENFSVRLENCEPRPRSQEDYEPVREAEKADPDEETVVMEEDGEPAQQEAPVSGETNAVVVLVNKVPTRLEGKENYIFVDIFDFISFDLTKQDGKSIVTTVNGQEAQYMQPLHDGDRIEIYWKGTVL